MARTASQALGGYYPTPPDVTPILATHLQCPIEAHARITVLDPCAGKGEAVLALADFITDSRTLAAYEVYGVEAETERAAELARAIKQSGAAYASTGLCADAFQVMWKFDRWNPGADLLFLNPPYDHDKEHGRLEEKFLDRFTTALRPGGVLIYLVPFHALKASAATLALHYHTISCYRFPEPDYDVFKQVALFAIRNDVTDPTRSEQGRIEAWARDPMTMPVLKEQSEPPYALPSGPSGFDAFKSYDVDVSSTIAAAAPGIGQRWLGLDLTPADMTDMVFPVAQSPSAAHISQALASGVLAGQRVEPDTPGLPPLLVNGTFERRYETVETKENNKGEVTGYVQVQKPMLRVSVLNLRTYEYHDLAQGSEPTDTTLIEHFNIADLLHHYQTSLVETLQRQCPALHDPTRPDHRITLPSTARTLYTVQNHAAQTCLKLLRQGDTPFLLGEVGTGKSVTSLTTAVAYGAKRILVFCPPHLTHSWVDQVQAVLPGAVAQIVEKLSDLQLEPEPGDQPGAGVIVYILAQTAGKLGHTVVAGTTEHHTCPRCGSVARGTTKELVSQRVTCKHRSLIAPDDTGQFVLDLAQMLHPCEGMKQQGLTRFAPGRILSQMHADWSAWAPGRLDELLERLGTMLLARTEFWQAFALLCVAHPGNVDALIARVARSLYEKEDATSHHFDTARTLLRVMQDTDLALAVAADLQALNRERVYSYHNVWNDFQVLLSGEKSSYGNGPRRVVAGFFYEHNQTRYERGDSAAALKAFRLLEPVIEWQRGPVCGEPLYQSTAKPRRYPIATWLSRYGRHLWDFTLLDEGQEYRNDGSANERAAHRLSEGKPTMLLSGSIGNGKASGLFANMWALSHRFRREFARDQMTTFVNIYGYRKQYVEVEDAKSEVISYGTYTDRVEANSQTTRKLGEAPGVLPLFILRHLMPVAVWMRKTDLDNELPSYTETREAVSMTSEQRTAYTTLERELLQRIAADRFQEGLAGKLFGQLGQLPSFLDRCTTDTGNGHDDTWVVAYPPHIAGGAHVTSELLLPASTELPKETWLIEKVRAELDEERNVLIFVQHTGSGLATRLQKVLTGAGISASYLDAGKVGTSKREAWVNQEIARGCRVLLVNPMAVQTGLNNLVHFCTGIWYEPVCDAIAWRQANGRLHRIGQTQTVRVIAATYAASPQGDVLDLNARKVRASMALDGLDISAALQASGAGEDDAEAAFELGQALYNRLTDPGYQRGEALTLHLTPAQHIHPPRQAAQPEVAPPTFKTVPASVVNKRRGRRSTTVGDEQATQGEALQYVMFDLGA